MRWEAPLRLVQRFPRCAREGTRPHVAVPQRSPPSRFFLSFWAVSYADGREGTQCAAQSDKFTCPVWYQTNTCQVGYECDTESGQCKETEAGSGLPQEQCEEQCEQDEFFRCNFDTMECEPCEDEESAPGCVKQSEGGCGEGTSRCAVSRITMASVLARMVGHGGGDSNALPAQRPTSLSDWFENIVVLTFPSSARRRVRPGRSSSPSAAV